MGIQAEIIASYTKATVKYGFSGTGKITVKGVSGFKVLIQAEAGKVIRSHPVF